ncbi:MAG: helix-turn-helix transcriptional regulator [Bacteroidetes bacterium]|nr:helix-turn-helix transcriptional regulator [Bacteroidota bacterium]
METYILDLFATLESLQKCRKRAGIKQEPLAFECDMTRSTYNKLENGKLKMKLEQFIRIAEKINTTPANIFLGAKKSNNVANPSLLIKSIAGAVILIENRRDLKEGSNEELEFIVLKLREYYSKLQQDVPIDMK